MKRKFLFNRLAGAGVLTAALMVAVAATAVAEPVEGARRDRRSGFNMLRSASTWVLQGNRVECGLWNAGEVCVDIFNSPTGGGGNWPVGSPNQYIFNSGLQIAGIVPYDSPFADWAGDTVGAYFFDARGTQPHAEAVTEIYSSLTAADVAAWPNGAVVRDADVYNPALLGRNSISQEDSWVRYYDGPNQLSGRAHPMGILVEQRSLAWNFPEGNQDIIFFVYSFTNITATDASAYSTLDPAIQSEVVEIAEEWVSRTEARLGIDIPSGGVEFDSVYAAFAMDPDVGVNYRQNASTAILPFNMGVAYNGSWDEPTWYYDPAIFRPPFGPFPGFVGVKYLRSPINPETGEEQGLALFSNTTNSARFPDPVGVSQLWRYLSGRIDEAQGDPPCDVNPPIERKLCATVQIPDDTRFYQSSGPFTLLPGQSGTIVVAYVHAAPIDAVVRPYYRDFLAPGIPSTGAAIAAGDTVRTLDRATGWVGHNDDDGNGVITQDEVETEPGSLLWKALVAQSLFDVQFLLPFAPEAPDFFLVPSDGQVTVVWQPSVTETIGDPYYEVASQEGSALFDPNYRFNDVEGYRVYKGRTAAQLQLVAQYDYSGTVFTDYTGNWAYDGQCAPELGVFDDCDEFTNFPDPADDPIEHDLTGEVAQVRPGGRVLLADGSVYIQESIDPVAEAGFPALSNTGVPFAYVDNGVTNSLTYYYAVSTFDYNSVVSGPGSLESSLIAKAVVPRASAPNLTTADVEYGLYGRSLLSETASFSFDGATGTFTGPPPPTDQLSVAGFQLFAPTALKAGSVVELTIDSIKPAYYEGDYWLTLNIDGQTSSLFYTGMPISTHDYPAGTFDPIPASLPADPDLADSTGQSGLPFAGQTTFEFDVRAVTFYSGDAEWHLDVDGSFWTSDGLTGLGPSRWFSGDDESTAYVPDVIWRGALDGVNVIHSPQPNWGGTVPGNAVYALFRRLRQSTWHAARQADVKFYWGETPGTLDSVIDVTHDLPVEFIAGGDAVYGVGWGFRDDIGGTGTTYSAADGIVTEYDFAWGPCYYGGLPSHTVGACETRPFVEAAVLQPVDIDGDGDADGNGFALYFNHEYYIFQTDALPSSTVWTHRSHFGLTTGEAGAYAFTPEDANPAVPGLAARFTVVAPAQIRELVAEDLDAVHTVPDPYYATNAMEVTPSQKVLKFVNLPSQAIVRIYSVSGVLVDVLEHNDPALGGELTWNVRNRNNQFVASGVYFYHVETPSGEEKIGRFTVINSGSIVIQR
ncbi:MAG: hypothetical protein PVH40_04635 [Gemmatimonadales bacterium]|jgi:hypothetical protein